MTLQTEPELEEPEETQKTSGLEEEDLLWWGGEGLGGESQPIRAREERERKRVEAVCLSNGTPSGDPQMKKAAWGQAC